MKRGREGYINNKKFQQLFEEKIRINNSDRILDVGCGIGTVPRLLNKVYGKTIQIIGIDLDQNLVEWGQKHWCRSENIHLSQGNVYALNFPPKYIEEELSLQSVIDFYRAHLGEDMVQRETIIVLESKLMKK